MKPIITGVKAGTQPSTGNPNGGSIVLSGLTPGVSYNVSYSNGTTQTATVVADNDGNVTIIGLSQGTYSSIYVTDPSGAEGEQASDVFPSSVVLDVAADPAPTRQGILNNYFGNQHDGGDAREAVIIGSENLIKNIRSVTLPAGALPATQQLLDLWIAETISLVEDTTTTYLEKLAKG